MTSPRIGSLFSGYGGLDQGVQAVIGGTTAWVSDIDPGACKILAYRYPGTPNLGDVSTVDWAGVTPVEIVTAGFPCQDVSPAGKQAGLVHGSRTGLWHETVRAIDELRPRMVVLENVRGLLTARGDEPTAELLAAWAVRDACTNLLTANANAHAIAVAKGDTDHARTISARRGRIMGLRKRSVARARRADALIVRALGTVLGTLADIGYDAVWHGLRAADVGAPHGRWRIFIVAYPQGNPWRFSDRDGASDPDSAELRRGTARRDDGLRSPRLEQGHQTLLPTPRTSDTNGPGVHGDGGIDLRTAVTMLPTPKARDHKGPGVYGDGGVDLPTALLLPTPRASDGAKGGPNQRGTSGDLMLPSAVTQRWGDYAPAIARWETVIGRPAPEPTTRSVKGNPQLAPRFVEWIMGLDDGWVTDVPGITRVEALKACGNGVVPQQAAAAVGFLLSVLEQEVAA